MTPKQALPTRHFPPTFPPCVCLPVPLAPSPVVTRGRSTQVRMPHRDILFFLGTPTRPVVFWIMTSLCVDRWRLFHLVWSLFPTSRPCPQHPHSGPPGSPLSRARLHSLPMRHDTGRRVGGVRRGAGGLGRLLRPGILRPHDTHRSPADGGHSQVCGLPGACRLAGHTRERLLPNQTQPGLAQPRVQHCPLS